MNALSIGLFRWCPAACLLLGVFALLGGCTQTRVFRLAQFTPGNEEESQPAPETGLYKIKAVGVSQDGVMTVPGSQRLLGQGQPLGFRRADDGQVLAIAGNENFPVADVGSVKYLIWYRSVDVPNAGLQNFGHGALEAAQFVGAAVLIGALLFADAALSGAGDADDDGGGHHDHRGHHHSGGHRSRMADKPDPGDDSP